MTRIVLTLLAAGAAIFPLPVLACAPVTVFFDWNSATLGPDGRAALERFALAMAWKGPDLDHVLLASHTDSSGSAAANRALALRRADAVRAVLLANEVPAGLIEIRTFAADRPRVPTPPNVREPTNRRVELLMQMNAVAQGNSLKDEAPIC